MISVDIHRSLDDTQVFSEDLDNCPRSLRYIGISKDKISSFVVVLFFSSTEKASHLETAHKGIILY